MMYGFRHAHEAGALVRSWTRPTVIQLVPVLLLLAAGCGPMARKPAVPDELADRAVVPGMPASIRSWSEHLNHAFITEVMRAGNAEIDGLRAAGQTLPPANYLAISGGGANGAYGAGVLCGWTAMGTRPTFKLVTGISTGALSAPFAFLGPAYDEKLREVYTQLSGKDVLEE